MSAESIPRSRKDVLRALDLADAGADQTAIATRLGHSQGWVSKVLKKAEDDGLVHRRLQFHRHLLPEHEQRFLRDRREPTELMEKLETLATRAGSLPLRGVRVFESVPNLADTSRPQMQVGRQAAQELAALLAKSRTIGVAWGQTLAGVIRVLATDPGLSPERRGQKTFVPLRGDCVGTGDYPAASSALAASLHAIYRRPGRPLSLLGVPALVPHALSGGADRRAIERLAQCSSAYAQLFLGQGRQPPLVDQLDTIITSCGATAEGVSPLTSQSLNLMALPDRKSIIGDVAGFVIAHPQASAAVRKLIDDRNRLWLGFQIDHLEDCAARAHNNLSAGVILIATGQRAKAEVVFECCVRHGLCSYLLLDRTCADQLNRIVDRELSAA